MSQARNKSPIILKAEPLEEFVGYDEHSSADNGILFDNTIMIKSEIIDPMDVDEISRLAQASTSQSMDEHFSEEENIYCKPFKLPNECVQILQTGTVAKNIKKITQGHNYTDVFDKSLNRNKKSLKFKPVCNHHQITGNSLICDVCNEVFLNEEDLTQHIETHKGKKLYICECGKGINSSRSAMESEAWKHYKKINNQDFAVCNYCSKKLSIKGSSTTGLLRHLKSKHPTIKYNLTIKNKCEDTGEIVQNKRIKINNTMVEFSQRISLAAVLAQMTAMDGLSVHKIVKSSFIRQSMSDRGYTLPKNVSDVMTLIKEYYHEMKNNLISKLNLIKHDNKFSITIDEWRNGKNRFFININIHYSDGECYNLGVIRNKKKYSAEKLLENITKKINSFGLSFSDVVGITSKENELMNLRELTQANYQFCYNRAIQKSVISSLYTQVNEYPPESDDNFSNYSTDSAYENDGTEQFVLIEDIDSIVRPVRKIVKYFKSSPKANAALQKYVLKKYNGEFPLILDRSMNWNTIELMIERFLKLNSAIKETLLSLNKSDYIIDVDDIENLESLLSILKPVKLAIEALSSKDANLITSEGVFKFLLETLCENDSIIAKNLLTSIISEINSKRNFNLVSVIQFLQNPEVIRSNNDFLILSSKDDIINYASKLNDKLFPNESNNEEKLDTTLSESSESTLSEKLKNKISGCFQTMPVYDNCNKSVSRQMAMYELNGRITPSLKQLLKALKTIKPTAMKAKDAFLVNTNSVLNKWTMLSDDSVDALCFLECHFCLNKLEK